ncbi:dihydrolipoyl dehydrogenase [Acinetobacter sp. MD2(2019)]|uniref:dihydrolipoyl dehydrogenase n=1 Tax=Acinetobacter sp. MD2(2019) TaxID=2605273 RepID=UPI002D1F0B7E|nr:dihydrolipoyl dehydrogenase [Acinetobacter sp. MD2(2019)]MEB3754297.1 dihydrolipoyl dehydrogenase [Acinetobacter sp. MD2(2019)]
MVYDLIIVGAGTAGISAYKTAVKKTQNILIVNDGPWDTTCARVGCMPSKVLISSANRLFEAQNLQQVGMTATLSADTTQVMQHVQQLRQRFTDATLKEVAQWPDEHKLSGRASFVNANTIEVNGQRYQAKRFILAVGSRPNINTEWQSQIADKQLTSDQIFELEQLPESIAVIGSGVIAIELAQALHRLGVHTTIFARSQKVGSLTSPELQHLAKQQLQTELNILFEVLPEQVSLQQNQVKIDYRQNAELHSIEVDYILNATGRSSLLSSLKLEQIDPSFSELKTLPVNPDTKQLANYPIFIAGDAFSHHPIQHEAANDGRIAVHNALNYPQIQPIQPRPALAIVFSSPEMAIVGVSYQSLIQQKIDFVVGAQSFERQGRATVLGKNTGAVEIYVDQHSRKILGAELFVEAAEHFAHLLNWMIGEQCTVDDLLQKPFYHPTLEEGLRSAFKKAKSKLDQTITPNKV